MGNRGALHDEHQRIVRFSAVRRWICCRTEFRGRRRELMSPGLYTELFFLDEATALAAGHRPCWECRREDALRFRAAWTRAAGRRGDLGADELDRALHEDRLERPGVMRRWRARCEELPDGTMVGTGERARLVLRDRLLEWSPAGYTESTARPIGPIDGLTPRSIVAALAAGHQPVVHETAG